MTRRVQIALWEEQYGLASHLLRRVWLDVAHVRKVLVDQRGYDNGVTIANEVEKYLEEKSLECGGVSCSERAALLVSMPDYHSDRHVDEEESVMEKKKFEITRQEMFEHCEECIFELPANEAWGLKMVCHDPGNILRIKAVREGTPAELVGLKVGDYIDEIGGDPLHEGGEERAVKCIKKHKREQDHFVEVVVMRELQQKEEETNEQLSMELRSTTS
jgi:C-terminal processing protease CtpA/Prc